jgi:hypothetical protein
VHGVFELGIRVVPRSVDRGLPDGLLGVRVQPAAEIVGHHAVDRPHAEDVLQQEECGRCVRRGRFEHPLADQFRPQ